MGVVAKGGINTENKQTNKHRRVTAYEVIINANNTVGTIECLCLLTSAMFSFALECLCSQAEFCSEGFILFLIISQWQGMAGEGTPPDPNSAHPGLSLTCVLWVSLLLQQRVKCSQHCMRCEEGQSMAKERQEYVLMQLRAEALRGNGCLIY